MKKKYVFVLIALLCFVASGFGQTTIYSEDFTGQNGKGAIGPTPTVDLTGVSWSINLGTVGLIANTDWLQVQNDVFEGRDLDGKGSWLSPLIDISSYINVQFSLDASEQGSLEADDNITTQYRIDGGTWTNAAINGNLSDDFGSLVVSQNGLSGSTL